MDIRFEYTVYYSDFATFQEAERFMKDFFASLFKKDGELKRTQNTYMVFEWLNNKSGCTCSEERIQKYPDLVKKKEEGILKLLSIPLPNGLSIIP